MFRNLLGALELLTLAKDSINSAKQAKDLDKRFAADVSVYNMLTLAFMGKDETIETNVRQVSPDHMVHLRWRDGKFMRPGVRYLVEVDPNDRRAATYFFTTPMSGQLITLVQQFVTSYTRHLALEVVTRFNNTSLMGHAATVGQTPPYAYNGQSSYVYCFAAALNYGECAKSPAEKELLENLTEATADAAVRLGHAIYYLAHTQDNPTTAGALGEMPKSKVQKSMKAEERRTLAEAFIAAIVDAGLQVSSSAIYAWTVPGNYGITDAYVTESGHLVIEKRINQVIPSEQRIPMADIIDQANERLLGKMGHIALDLDSGKVVYRTGFRAFKGHKHVDGSLLKSMLTEHMNTVTLLGPRLEEVVAGRLAGPIVLPEWPLLSESRRVALDSRFVFGA